MSDKYDVYLINHKGNVRKGYEWLKNNLPNIFEVYGWENYDFEHLICFEHDNSKSLINEYVPYDNYFYGGIRSYEVVQAFNKAWLFHIHRNPHHWQYWILKQDKLDSNGNQEIYIDMEYPYIIEMICDWWSFSWGNNNLFAIFKWYEESSPYIKVSEKTRGIIEVTLKMMKDKLLESGVYENEKID